MKIVTITLNPALDLTTRLEAMSLGEVNLVSEANLRAAGKGINVCLLYTSDAADERVRV